MKIAIFTDTFLPQINGVTNTLHRFGEYLEDQKIDYIFITPKQGNLTSSHKGNCNMDIPYNVESFLSAPFILYPDCRVTFPNWIRLTKKLDTFKPDLIFLMTEFTMGFCGLTYAKLNKLPVISNYSTHFNMILKSYNLSAFEKILEKYLTWFHQEADLTTTPSHDSEEHLINMGVSRTHIFSRGIDCNLFSPTYRSHELRRDKGIENKIVLLYVGRLSWEKDLKVLCDAMYLLNKNYKDKIHLIITGDGPIRQELEQLMPENTTFTGNLMRQDLSRIYASSDIFVFPSSFETFGNVVIEAFASGLPVVGVNKGGVKNLVHPGINGFLAEPNQAESFAAEIEKLLLHDLVRCQCGNEALKEAKTRSWDTVFSDLLGVFQKLTNNDIAPIEQTSKQHSIA